MDLILCAAQDVSQGQAASAELAADYTNGTLDGPTFLAAVNRVIALRQSLG
jgi:beta-N-acetylhexosaminidase